MPTHEMKNIVDLCNKGILTIKLYSLPLITILIF